MRHIMFSLEKHGASAIAPFVLWAVFLTMILLMSACAGQQRIATEMQLNGSDIDPYTHHVAKLSYGIQW